MIDYAYRVELYHIAGESITPPHEPEVLYDSIAGLGAAFQSAESDRGAGECPSIDFAAIVTVETRDFLKPITDPRHVHVIITEYDNFDPTTTKARFAGKLLELPRRSKDADNDLYVFQAVGFLTTYDEVTVANPVPGGGPDLPYRDEYFTDLIDNVLSDAGHSYGKSIKTKALTSGTDFTSRLFYPGKHKFGGGYNTTDRITALCSDGTYLYLGVGHWLCRYDPLTRARELIVKLTYKGSKLNLLDNQFRVKSIEYDAGAIHGWAESIYPNIFETVSHVKFPFKVFPPASPGFEKFLRSAPITIAAATALTAIDTMGVDVWALTFDTPDYSDRAIAYYNGTNWEEIDSDYRDIGDGYRIYFRLQGDIGAATTNTTSYRLFWRGAGRVTKTNRDNIYLGWDDFQDGTTDKWTLSSANPAIWRLVLLAGNYYLYSQTTWNPWAYITGVTVTDYRAFWRGTTINNGAIKGFGITGRGQLPNPRNVCYGVIGEAAVAALGGADGVKNVTSAYQVPYLGFNATVWGQYEAKQVGNVQEAWIDGVAMTPDNQNTLASGVIGFAKWGDSSASFDDLYVLHAVLNEPVVALGATELINGFYDADMIYNYDRGYLIKSTPREAKNYGGPSGNDWVEWFYGDIGEAQPISTQDLGIPMPADRKQTTLFSATKVHDTFLFVNPQPGHPFHVGDRVYLHSGVYRQDMGLIKKIILRPQQHGYWYFSVENQCQRAYPIPTKVYWLTPEELRKNVHMPGYRDVKIHYDQPYDEGSATPINVRVERRTNYKGKGNFYFPEILGTVSEDQTLETFTPYLALGECNYPQQYRIDGADTYYRTEGVPPFNLHMYDVARFANLPVAGYWVQNNKQESDRDQVGRNRLMFNGNPVRIVNESGDPKIETYCNIFLAQDGNKFYCAFNRWRDAAYSNAKFYQIVWGELNGAEFTMVGVDRPKEYYFQIPPRELTGFTHYQNKYWFGVKRIEPRWIETGIEIIWAAPPQAGDKPTDYDGGLAVVCMVTYDKTEYLAAGKLFRRSRGGYVHSKEYLISEVASIAPRNITTTLHSHEIYGWEGRTYFVALELDPYYPPTTYDRAAKWEMLAPVPGYPTYLTLMDTYDIRGEICYAEPNNLVVAHTATAPAQDNFEGDYYDFHQQEWHGEETQPEMYGRMAEADLSEDSVIDPTIEPIIVTLKNGKKEFTLANGGLVDVTDNIRGEMQIPPLGQVYLDRHGPWNKKRATLYFNPAYAGMFFDVEYHRYPERFYVEPFVHDGKLHFNETARPGLRWILDPLSVAETPQGTIYQLNDTLTWDRVTTWPGPVGTITVHGDDVYALADDDGALMKYGKEWPGYIRPDVGGADTVDAFQVLTEISKAADMFLGEEAGVIKLRHRGTGDSVGFFLDCEDFEIADLTEVPKYKAVLVTYDGGKAYYGPDDVPDRLILSKSMRYVTDYGHALLLAKLYYDYYQSGVNIYDVKTTRPRLGLPILGEVGAVGEIQGRVVEYTALGPSLGMRIEKTTGDRLEIGVPL